jgi:hypothetical protein
MIPLAAIAITLGLAQPQAPASASACGAQAPPPQECIIEVRVHGNHTTPDAEVLRLAAVEPGQPFTVETLARIRKALDDSGRFRSVDVRKRYTSLSDPSAILLVIVVEERAGIAIDVPNPGPMRTLRAHTMWMPILRSEDGYGLTYGVRVSFVDVLGRRTRLSAPLSWGGERRAAVEIERRFERGPLTRVVGTGGIARREHPTLDIGDRRAGAGIRAERALTSWLQVAGGGGFSDIRFGDVDDRLKTLGGDVVVDTRRDPAFPRNAVYAAVGLQRLWFDSSPDNLRLTVDARGFVGCSARPCWRCGRSTCAPPIRCRSTSWRCWAEMRRYAGSSWATGPAIACWPGRPRSACRSPLHAVSRGWASPSSPIRGRSTEPATLSTAPYGTPASARASSCKPR